MWRELPWKTITINSFGLAMMVALVSLTSSPGGIRGASWTRALWLTLAAWPLCMLGMALLMKRVLSWSERSNAGIKAEIESRRAHVLAMSEAECEALVRQQPRFSAELSSGPLTTALLPPGPVRRFFEEFDSVSNSDDELTLAREAIDVSSYGSHAITIGDPGFDGEVVCDPTTGRVVAVFPGDDARTELEQRGFPSVWHYLANEFEVDGTG